MRSYVTLAILGTVLACPCVPCFVVDDALSAAALADERSDRVTFYRVPLTCPAARGLGCGSAAKPVLLELERTSLIDEAWLDQTGQTLAIVWTRDSGATDRQAALTALAEARGLSVDEVTGEARTSALTTFKSGKGWHRGADVDRLSEQEAHVIADRLLARLVANAPSAKAKVATLRPTLTETIGQLLVGSSPSPEVCRDKIMATARQHLTAAELSALEKAVEAGYRPLGDER
jgi:hypothetical protein